MTTTMGLVYIMGILGFFGIIFWVLINKIMKKPVDFTKQKKMERMAKKQSSSKG